MMKFAKKLVRRAVPGAVMAYGFFLLFPHVTVLTHAHAGGAGAHHHAFLSKHDLGLERAALAVAPEGTPNGELEREESPRVHSTGKHAVGKNDRGLTLPRGLAHMHVQDDPNVLGLGIPEFAPQAPAIRPEAPAFAVALAPAAAPFAAPARAPPRA